MKKVYALGVCALALALLVAPASANTWDESINGDLSNDEANPTPFSLDFGSNLVIGTVGGSSPGEFFDALTINVPVGATLDAVFLDSYVVTGGNTSTGFNVATGTSWDGSFTAPNFVGSATLTVAGIGSDVLDDPDLGGSFGPGDYVVGLREGTPGQAYQLDFVLVPEPATLGLLALGALLIRRR